MFTLIVTKSYILFLCIFFACNLYPAAPPPKIASIEQDKDDYLERLKKLCAKRLHVNIKDNHGNYALHAAAQENHLPILHFLLEQNASMYVQDRCKDTAFHWAAFKGHAEALQILLLYEKRKAKLPPEYNRILPLANILACLPHSILSMIIEYTGLENAKGESLPSIMLPSLTLKNQWGSDIREIALKRLKKYPTIPIKDGINECIQLMESHYSNVMYFLISTTLAEAAHNQHQHHSDDFYDPFFDQD